MLYYKCMVDDNGNCICLKNIETIEIYYDVVIFIFANKAASPHIFTYKSKEECFRDFDQLKEELVKLGCSLQKIVEKTDKMKYNVEQEKEKGEHLLKKYMVENKTMEIYL